MASPAASRIKITYATLRNDNEELHARYEEGIVRARQELGRTHPMYIGSEERSSDSLFEDRSPIDDNLVVGRFVRGTRKDAQDAIAAARAAFADWGSRPWSERIAIMRAAADRISERQMEISALMAIEVGKNRLEALGDVEESADLIRWYCDELERHHGFDDVMGNLGDAAVHTRSVLKPFGVWVVISPFNFPASLAGGPAGAALVAGNTVVLKPSSDAPMTALKLYEAFRDGGVPAGAINLVTGPGESVGAELQENPDVDGLTFTGSYEVGMNIYRSFARAFPKPVVCEMGGKNPAIVSRKADLELAAEGVMRSAFGYGGQKCSACSRVYVERPVRDEFLRILVEKTKGIAIGDPLAREHWLGPVINAKAVVTYERAVADARRDGTVLTGGERLTGEPYDRGYFVAPTVVTDLPVDHRLFREELFVPFVAVAAVDSIDEALGLANDNVYGLTAGFFSRDRAEIDAFLGRIEGGVVYVNRRAGATTGAWPGIQPFGGWKGSGTTGKAGGGFYYVQQYLREQSQTVVD